MKISYKNELGQHKPIFVKHVPVTLRTSTHPPLFVVDVCCGTFCYMKHIENIGALRYFISIIIGSNYRVVSLQEDGEDVEGDFLATISKKVFILTEQKDGRRCPIIVRKWKKGTQKSMPIPLMGEIHTTSFVDLDAQIWKLTKSGSAAAILQGYKPMFGELKYQLSLTK